MKINETIYLQYFDFLLKGDRDKCTEIVFNLLEQNVQPVDIYENVFQRSMYRVGKLWEQDKITVAHEHIASNITEALIDVVSTKLKKGKKNSKKIIITCVEKEFHCLGAKIIADYFDFLGWEVIMLGANTPVNEMLKLIEEKKPDLIGVSNSFYLNILRLINFIEKIREKFPDQKIVVGGQALSEGKDDLLDRFSGVNYVSTIRGLDKLLKLENL